ncbi:MAG TPA: hypothetical protein VK960_03635 [Acidimicrobiia bacterium]|nr:hypothetical protein [Acidimicrobiia bacterium]
MTGESTAIIPEEGLQARRLPDRNAEVIARLHPTVEVIVREQRGEWSRVEFPDGEGRDLWVVTDALKQPEGRRAETEAG